MRRSFPVGEVSDLRSGETLTRVCRCGSRLGGYRVVSVREKTAVVESTSRDLSYRVKRRDIYYRGGRAYGDHFVVSRSAAKVAP